MEQWIIILVLLIACLIALLLVLFARREAAAEREAAQRDVNHMRAEAKAAAARLGAAEERLAAIAADERRLAREREKFHRSQQEELAQISGLTVEQARSQLVKKLEQEAESEVAGAIRKIEKRVRDDAEKRVREILVDAMQRQAGPATAQQSVAWVELASEEMKGRIIGREGRNIRAFEAVTGVNLVVEEGVNAVLVSSFDVERREIAEVTLRSLLDDGRIQPQRIEAAYADAVRRAPERSRDAALDALEKAGISGVATGLVDIIGRLRLRSSYGQNVLAHMVECAGIAADIARELGADVETCRRAAFLHDLGKAFTGERPGTHAAIGAEVAAQHGEPPEVVHAIAAHHDEVPPQAVEDVVVQIADAVSASRPGARREDAQGYVERLEALEAMVGEIPGVAEVMAMSAGREVRVLVEPSAVGDSEVADLARTIAGRIDKDPRYPGEVKVTVIRELRADAVAGEA